jgi:hypothetical protein
VGFAKMDSLDWLCWKEILKWDQTARKDFEDFRVLLR